MLLAAYDGICIWMTRLPSSWLASRFDGGCDEGHADGFVCRNISGHPWNWCLQVHGSHDLSVYIGMGYVIAGWCLHPQNLLHVVDIGRGSVLSNLWGFACT